MSIKYYSVCSIKDCRIIERLKRKEIIDKYKISDSTFYTLSNNLKSLNFGDDEIVFLDGDIFQTNKDVEVLFKKRHNSSICLKNKYEIAEENKSEEEIHEEKLEYLRKHLDIYGNTVFMEDPANYKNELLEKYGMDIEWKYYPACRVKARENVWSIEYDDEEHWIIALKNFDGSSLSPYSNDNLVTLACSLSKFID